MNTMIASLDSSLKSADSLFTFLFGTMPGVIFGCLVAFYAAKAIICLGSVSSGKSTVGTAIAAMIMCLICMSWFYIKNNWFGDGGWCHQEGVDSECMRNLAATLVWSIIGGIGLGVIAGFVPRR
jgi:NhaP-type Na+/H+ or K+/H+ antiporter